MAAPAVVQELVERFQAQIESYRAGAYNETQLRREFLDPFFEALGWDVFNRKGYAEAYKEVIHEDAIRIGGRTKAPDYCFRAGSGIRSLFVEAEEAIGRYPRRRQPCLPTPPLRLVGQAGGEHSHRFRGVRRLRLPHAAGKERQSDYRPHHLPRLHAVYRALGLSVRPFFAGGDSPRIAGKTRRVEEDQEGNGGGRYGVSRRDRSVARRAVAKHRPAESGHFQPRPEFRRAADHRPHRLPADLRRPRHRAIRQPSRVDQRREHLCPTGRMVPPRRPALQLGPVLLRRRAGPGRAARRNDAGTEDRRQAVAGNHPQSIFPRQPL